MRSFVALVALAIGLAAVPAHAKEGVPRAMAWYQLTEDELTHPAPQLPQAVLERVPPGGFLHGLYRVCLDVNGRVHDVTVVTSIPGADESVRMQIKAGWTYRPRGEPACFDAPVWAQRPGGNGMPPAGASPRTVPAFVLAKDVVSHEPPHLPPTVQARYQKRGSVHGSYKVCLGLDGRVSDVMPVSRVEGADEAVMAQIKAGWTYKPQTVPVCFMSVVRWQLPAGPKPGK